MTLRKKLILLNFVRRLMLGIAILLVIWTCGSVATAVDYPKTLKLRLTDLEETDKEPSDWDVYMTKQQIRKLCVITDSGELVICTLDEYRLIWNTYKNLFWDYKKQELILEEQKIVNLEVVAYYEKELSKPHRNWIIVGALGLMVGITGTIIVGLLTGFVGASAAPAVGG